MGKVNDGNTTKLIAESYKSEEINNPLDGLTPTQVENWVNNNVTDLASAKNALIKIGRVLIILQAEIDSMRYETWGADI